MLAAALGAIVARLSAVDCRVGQRKKNRSRLDRLTLAGQEDPRGGAVSVRRMRIV